MRVTPVCAPVQHHKSQGDRYMDKLRLLPFAFVISLSVATPADAQDIGRTAGLPEAESIRFEKVEFDSFEREGFFSSEPVRLSGFLMKAAPSDGRVAVLAHPCQGLLREDGSLWPKYRRMAKALNENGLTVLLVDSFTPRGKLNICSESSKTRVITTDTRKKDNLAALAYLRARSDLPQGRALLMGWGNSSVLETVSEREATHRFDAAVAWYPPCQSLGPIEPTVPVLVLVGEKDDWNPAAACQALASRLPSSPTFQVVVFPETFHSFDTPNRPQRTVRWAGGVSTVGSNPQATEDAYRRILEFVSSKMPAAFGVGN